MSINPQGILEKLPPQWQDDLIPEIQTSVIESKQKIIVLDDDPTGTQTVYDVPILTSWGIPELTDMLIEPKPLAYILTNSRSLSSKAAITLNNEICSNLAIANQSINRDYVVISRSDSTLRGHFPSEIDVIIQWQKVPVDGIILVPFFEEGRRYTVDDVHYVGEGNFWTPAGETEFAKDATFGYKSSDLREWVSEKTSARIAPTDVLSLDIQTIRKEGPSGVAKLLLQAHNQQVCIVNAITYRDLEVFVCGLLRAEKSGKRFVYRSAASFVRVRAGLYPRSLLKASELAIPPTTNGGLIIAGSYIPKSTRQISNLQQLDNIASIEVSVLRILDRSSRDIEIERVSASVEASLNLHQDALVYTSRDLVKETSNLKSLEVNESISNALVEIVQKIHTSPAWIVAKGGITSSDIATKGLGIRLANVIGQILPGVPVWKTGDECKWKEMIYVVFPGNVGTDESISQVVTTLRESTDHLRDAG